MKNSTIAPEAIELATNLVKLTKEFESSDPGQSSNIKRAFKTKSKNDTVRTVTYLLEVVGSKDFECKQLQQEIADLKELLKVNNISLEGPSDEEVKKGLATAQQSPAEGTPEGTGIVAPVGSVETVGQNGPEIGSEVPPQA